MVNMAKWSWTGFLDFFFSPLFYLCYYTAWYCCFGMWLKITAIFFRHSKRLPEAHQKRFGNDLQFEVYTTLFMQNAHLEEHGPYERSIWPRTACVKWRADDLKTVKHVSDIKRWWATTMAREGWVGGARGDIKSPLAHLETLGASSSSGL